jgi:hypothetical protein
MARPIAYHLCGHHCSRRPSLEVWSHVLCTLRTAAVILAGVTHDVYPYLLCDAACTQADVRRRLTGPLWMVAVAESVPIRVFSELGHTVGQLERGEFQYIGHRFE